MIDREREELSVEIREATRLLRDAPAPSDVWRQRLLRELEAAPSPGAAPLHVERMPRRWSMHPLTAIAAGLVCALVGGATVAIIAREPMTPPVIASELQRVRFVLVAPAAAHVSIVGDFNGWNPRSLPLLRSADGKTWEVEVPLAPGRYAYSFVVDGALARDPSALQATDDDFGSPNSIVMVKGS